MTEEDRQVQRGRAVTNFRITLALTVFMGVGGVAHACAGDWPHAIFDGLVCIFGVVTTLFVLEEVRELS